MMKLPASEFWKIVADWQDSSANFPVKEQLGDTSLNQPFDDATLFEMKKRLHDAREFCWSAGLPVSYELVHSAFKGQPKTHAEMNLPDRAI